MEVISNPVIGASLVEDHELLEALLLSGADAEACDASGVRVLVTAARAGSVDIVKVLLRYGAEVYSSKDGENSPLVEAASAGHFFTVRILKNANLHHFDRQRALLKACLQGHFTTFLELAEFPKDLRLETDSGIDLLGGAADGGHMEMVRFLLENGADPCKLNRQWTSPLHLAAAKGHLEIVRLLVSAGADLLAQNQGGLTPISVALYNGHESVVEFLAERMDGRGLNIRANNSLTALLYAILHSRSVRVIEEILRKGADPDLSHSTGYSPLHCAAEMEQVEVSFCLIDHGADVNIEDTSGSTPLDVALRKDNQILIRRLRQNSAVSGLEKRTREEPEHDAASGLITSTAIPNESNEDATGTSPSSYVDEKGATGESFLYKNTVHGHTQLSALVKTANLNGSEQLQSLFLEDVQSLATALYDLARDIRNAEDVYQKFGLEEMRNQFPEVALLHDLIATHAIQIIMKRLDACNCLAQFDVLLRMTLEVFDLVEDDPALVLGVAMCLMSIGAGRVEISLKNFPNPARCIKVVQFLRLTLFKKKEAAGTENCESMGTLDHLEEFLAHLFSFLYELDPSCLEYLNSAIHYARNVMNRGRSDNQENVDSLQRLNVLFHWLYDSTGSLPFLNEAIACLRMLVKHCKSSVSFSYVVGINDLAHDLAVRHSKDGRTDDLEEALKLVAEAHNLVRNSELSPVQSCLGEVLTNHGNILDQLYDSNGNIEHLKQSIRFATESLSLEHTVVENRAVRLSNLAYRYGTSYQHTQVIKDLENGLALSKEAALVRDCSRATKYLALNSYCGLLHQLLNRDKPDRLSVDRLIRVAKLAVGSAVGKDSVASSMYNLSICLAFRYRLYQDDGDLKSAIEYSLRCLRTISWNDSHRAMYWSGLGFIHELLYEKDHEEATLRYAIELHELALARAPNCDQAAINLGTACVSRAIDTRLAEDETIAIASLESVLDMPSAPTERRVRAGGLAVLFALSGSDRSRGLQIIQKIEKLLPALYGHLRNPDDLRHVLATLHNLSESAAIACLRAGKNASEALLRAELMRGIAAEMLLAERGGEGAPAESPSQMPTSKHTHHATTVIGGGQYGPGDLPTLLTSFSGEGFKKATGLILEEVLEGLSGTRNAIIDFVVTRTESHVLALTKDGVTTSQLPNLRYIDVQGAVNMLTGKERVSALINGERSERNRRLKNLLGWLWRQVVKPVLTNLDMLRNAGDKSEPPRIWWVASGSCGSLPFHAAGNGRLGTMENTVEHVISSYIPSLKGLIHTKRLQNALKPSTDLRGLVVTMPSTAGFPRINAEREVKALRDLVRDSTILENPSVTKTLSCMEHCHLCHFSCHGTMDAADPWKAKLVLGDATRQDPLTVEQLWRSRFRDKWLLYLAACSTAENSADRLGHEVIHLASAFQLAGFPGVIGCLWEADSFASGSIAESFYARLAGAWHGAFDQGVLAQALHEAVIGFREQNAENALAWAPFVYYGV